MRVCLPRDTRMASSRRPRGPEKRPPPHAEWRHFIPSVTCRPPAYQIRVSTYVRMCVCMYVCSRGLPRGANSCASLQCLGSTSSASPVKPHSAENATSASSLDLEISASSTIRTWHLANNNLAISSVCVGIRSHASRSGDQNCLIPFALTKQRSFCCFQRPAIGIDDVKVPSYFPLRFAYSEGPNIPLRF